ncbi:hypothetical protein L6164_006970 [Bauhinia variegata]|uniref:Uncharacterized protein n=1 Tax=Bauhinia variegata TaxID=167791 RepID=A0ACB9PXK1_BAUVA|nr:hypothetical protein L6164_006970 [Bauhinia variegata]
MNTTSVSFFFFFTLSLILISAKGSLIEDTCNEVRSQAPACITILSSDPRIAAASNKNKLAKLTLQMCVDKATEAQNVIKGLAAAAKNPALEACATTHYDYVVGSFKSCLMEITQDPQSSNYDARVSGDGAGYCDTAMSKANLINPVVSAKNKEMVMLSFVAYAVTNNL